MKKLICPNCEKRRSFNSTEKENYNCNTCNQDFKKCRIEDCSNLVATGFVCKKCIGKGLKNGGVVAITGLLAVGGVAFKFLRK